MRNKRSTITAVLVTAVFLLLFLVNSGCTQIEKDGFSPIPQNTPASWEINPYGDNIFR